MTPHRNLGRPGSSTSILRLSRGLNLSIRTQGVLHPGELDGGLGTKLEDRTERQGFEIKVGRQYVSPRSPGRSA